MSRPGFEFECRTLDGCPCPALFHLEHPCQRPQWELPASRRRSTGLRPRSARQQRRRRARPRHLSPIARFNSKAPTAPIILSLPRSLNRDLAGRNVERAFASPLASMEEKPTHKGEKVATLNGWRQRLLEELSAPGREGAHMGHLQSVMAAHRSRRLAIT